MVDMPKSALTMREMANEISNTPANSVSSPGNVILPFISILLAFAPDA